MTQPRTRIVEVVMESLAHMYVGEGLPVPPQEELHKLALRFIEGLYEQSWAVRYQVSAIGRDLDEEVDAR